MTKHRALQSTNKNPDTHYSPGVYRLTSEKSLIFYCNPALDGAPAFLNRENDKHTQYFLKYKFRKQEPTDFQ
jgi:hypothetical protein